MKNLVPKLACAAALLSTQCWADDALTGIRQISAGTRQTCAALDDGNVACWGINTFGLLGTGESEPLASPALVIRDPSSRTPLQNIRTVATREFVTCAPDDSETVYCWGDGTSGATGVGDFAIHPFPMRTNAAPASAIAVGSQHACAILDDPDRTVRCWGSNAQGQLGDSSNENRFLPNDVFLDRSHNLLKWAMQITAGDRHTCVRLGDSTAMCWGANEHGQLGDGTLTDSALPVHVAITNRDGSKTVLSGIDWISAGDAHTCAKFDTGRLACWGNNSHGQVGDPKAPMIVTSPVSVATSDTFNTLSAGSDFTCAIVRSTGNLACWGGNESYQLGIGGGEYARPTYLPETLSAKNLSTGSTHTCIVNPLTTAQCWGSDSGGELGSGGFGAATLTAAKVVKGNVGDQVFASGLEFVPL